MTKTERKELEEEKKQKKKARLIGAAVVALIAILVIILYAWSATRPIDRILLYEVQVVPQEDGQMEITYHLQWEVLDSEREGPLTWVKLGMANEDFEIKAFGGDIESVRYNSGPYAQFYLTRPFVKGDVADFWFTVSQNRMLCSNPEDPAEFFYDFAPGWFDAIDVDRYRFTWDTGVAVKRHNADTVDGDKLVWTGSLRRGETREMMVYYNRFAFPRDDLTTWTPSPVTPGNSDGPTIDRSVILVIVIFAAAIIVQIMGWGNSYRRGRGYHGGGHGGGCACACAGCACACACAGGGRAGCTNKDFYDGNPFQKALEKKE